MQRNPGNQDFVFGGFFWTRFIATLKKNQGFVSEEKENNESWRSNQKHVPQLSNILTFLQPSLPLPLLMPFYPDFPLISLATHL